MQHCTAYSLPGGIRVYLDGLRMSLGLASIPWLGARLTESFNVFAQSGTECRYHDEILEQAQALRL
jgi:hypothetical protein